MDETLVKTERKRLMSPAGPYIEEATRRQFRVTMLGALGAFLSMMGLWIWTWVGWSQWAVPMSAAGAAIFATSILAWMYNERALKFYFTVKDEVEVSERENPADGKLVATLTPDPKRPNRVVSGPVRLTGEQWACIYKASSANGWKFSRPLIEKSGANVVNLNKIYGRLYPWMEDHDLIENLKPGQKNPQYFLTRGGVMRVREWSKAAIPLSPASGVS